MNHFIDIKAKKSIGVPAYASLGYCVKFLHLHISRYEDPSLFISFPKAVFGDNSHPGDIVRVFASSKEKIEILLKYITADSRFIGLLEFGRIRAVPENVDKFECFYRVRLPSRNKNAHYEGQKALLNKKRFDIANEIQKLPYIPMQSGSNKASYPLNFNRTVQNMSNEQAAQENATGKGDGYGMSHKTAPIWIPCVGTL